MESEQALTIDVVRSLEAPDTHYLQAACGWVGLSDADEAEAELDQISLAAQSHPDVLQLRWRIHAMREEWTVCLDIAKSLTQIVPERRFGWIHLAMSYHRLGRSEEAREILFYALDMFEPNATMAFFLARYSCALGEVTEGWQWLQKAFELVRQPSERRCLMEKAMSEPDLACLREFIADMG